MLRKQVFRDARLRHGWTIYDVAREANYTHQGVSAFELDKAHSEDLALFYITQFKIPPEEVAKVYGKG